MIGEATELANIQAGKNSVLGATIQGATLVFDPLATALGLGTAPVLWVVTQAALRKPFFFGVIAGVAIHGLCNGLKDGLNGAG